MATRTAQPPGAATPGFLDGFIGLSVATFNVGATTDNHFAKKAQEFTDKLFLHTRLIEVVHQVCWGLTVLPGLVLQPLACNGESCGGVGRRIFWVLFFDGPLGQLVCGGLSKTPHEPTAGWR
jgi:hypothetical protein